MRVAFKTSWVAPLGAQYMAGDRAEIPPTEARAAIAAGAAVELPSEEQAALNQRTKMVSDQSLMVKAPAPPSNATPEPRGGKKGR